MQQALSQRFLEESGLDIRGRGRVLKRYLSFNMPITCAQHQANWQLVRLNKILCIPVKCKASQYLV